VAVLRAGGRELELLASSRPAGGPQRFRRLDVDAPLVLAEAVRVRAPVVVDAAAAEARRFPLLGELGDEAGAVAAVPLSSGQDVLGAFVVVVDDREALDAEALATLRTVGQLAGQALERARLYAAERDARERVGRLQGLTAALSGSVTPAEVRRGIVRESVAALGARVGAIVALAEDGALLPAAAALRGGEPRWLRTPEEVRAAAPPAGRREAAPGGAEAFVPLVAGRGRANAALVLSLPSRASSRPRSRPSCRPSDARARSPSSARVSTRPSTRSPAACSAACSARRPRRWWTRTSRRGTCPASRSSTSAATGTTSSTSARAASGSRSATSSAAGCPQRRRWASCAARSPRSCRPAPARRNCSSASTRSPSHRRRGHGHGGLRGGRPRRPAACATRARGTRRRCSCRRAARRGSSWPGARCRSAPSRTRRAARRWPPWPRRAPAAVLRRPRRAPPRVGRAGARAPARGGRRPAGLDVEAFCDALVGALVDTEGRHDDVALLCLRPAPARAAQAGAGDARGPAVSPASARSSARSA
jgi:hypothetical protein